MLIGRLVTKTYKFVTEGQKNTFFILNNWKVNVAVSILKLIVINLQVKYFFLSETKLFDFVYCPIL